jgi:methionyl-tRNA formyltransferase
MNPWPSAWFEWNGNSLKVLRVSVINEEKNTGLGVRYAVDGKPAIQSANGGLVLEEVQPAGRKPMSGKSFLAGARDWIT